MKPFSELEQSIIDIIGDRKVSISEIAEEHFKTHKRGLNGNSSVAGYIRRITAKCQYHGLSWTIKGEGLGRMGRVVWRHKIVVRRPHA